MDQNLENNIDKKNKLLEFYNSNKIKIIICLVIAILIGVFITFLNYKNVQKNKLISEKYIQAGLYLSSDNKNDAKILLEEIILSKNEFYSLLALNVVVEKKLILEKDKIIEYFETLEKTISSKNNKDLIVFKKALFLIKEGDKENGINLLKELIKDNSSLKLIIQELIDY